MATWPESSPTPRYPLAVTIRFNTLISSFDGGGEQRRQKLLYPQYDTVIKYDTITKTEAQTLYNFYIARQGSYEAFYIYDLSLLLLHTFVHTNQYMGTGDGSTTIFDIPGRSTSSQTIYTDGADATSDGSILTGGGASSSDRFTFNTAPIIGMIITCDFAGYLRMRVRFQDDKLTRENFICGLYNMGTKLKGVAPA